MRYEAPRSRRCRGCRKRFRPNPFSHNQTRCRPCYQDKLRQRRQRRKHKRFCPGGSSYRGKAWAERSKPLRDFCAICGATKSLILDHIVRYRLAKRWGDPNATENLICLCRACHGKKGAIEHRLERGNLVGFLSELNCIGFPRRRVLEALKFYSALPHALEEGTQ